MSTVIENQSKESSSGAGEVFAFFKTIFIVVALAVTVRFFLVEPFKIPSGSMKPTLMIGDFILVSKLDFGIRIPFVPDRALTQYATPQRRDIVVFTRPDDPTTKKVDESAVNLIKRVIAIAGDTVEVKGNVVRVNGTALEEESVWWLDGGTTDFGPETVPEGHVFLLGDNRDHSKDSRFWKPSPFLSVGRIVGKAYIIYWSWDSFDRIGTFLK